MTIKTLEIWARVVEQDGLTGTEQVRELVSNETEKGWLNLATASTQQMNGILKSITQHSGCNPFAPELILDAASIPATSLEWVDGGAIVEEDSPELYAHYGATFPTLQSTAPSGWKYIVRNQ
ncbi:hypothetical protein VPHG_00094 [Vibrio phage 11895-B1]|uniref:hypothetical protein n=1 Tax=Vibrio phage 11895-B1 TaxID=754075 RepID=UPI0002C0D782|nr:hypothetical protein VPHG_00094 [Vibrio phage 11895-B1]AGH32161.1 hypothetical protein VPHG_00094 [Vibrio phage 11895-B1]